MLLLHYVYWVILLIHILCNTVSTYKVYFLVKFCWTALQIPKWPVSLEKICPKGVVSRGPIPSQVQLWQKRAEFKENRQEGISPVNSVPP